LENIFRHFKKTVTDIDLVIFREDNFLIYFNLKFQSLRVVKLQIRRPQRERAREREWQGSNYGAIVGHSLTVETGGDIIFKFHVSPVFTLRFVMYV